MRGFLTAILLIYFSWGLAGQQAGVTLTGKVSFVSSVNVYVKFTSTAGISAGDTLFVLSGGSLVPVLTVDNLSSVSCVCTPISALPLAVDRLIVARVALVPDKTIEKPDTAVVAAVVPVDAGTDTTGTGQLPVARKQEIKGSIAVASYTDGNSAGAPGSQRFRYTLSLNAGNIGGSRVSMSSYVTFRHKVGEWQAVRENMAGALKVYDLWVGYDLGVSARVTAGRRINPGISGIGASDGVQLEKSFGRVGVGALAGFRPDYLDWGFNPHLFQIGAFVTASTGREATFTQSSVAIMQQMNGAATDRRFIYVQHSHSLITNLNLLGSFEIDLFRLEDGKPRGTFSLTGLYLSMRYRPVRGVSVTGSYDARRNVIYYETFKTFTDRLLEDELRQGYRFGASWRINNRMNTGFNAGYRFLKTDPAPSRNLHGYYTYSQVPFLNLSATISATLLTSSHMNGYLGAVNISKSLMGGVLQTGAGYHYVNYLMPENLPDIRQHVAEISVAAQASDKISFQLYYEGTFELSDTFSRVYIQARKRF